MHLFVGILALMKYEFQYLLDINGRVSTQLRLDDASAAAYIHVRDFRHTE